MANFTQVYPNSHYPYVLLICVASVFAIGLVEQAAIGMMQKRSAIVLPWLSYSLMILLSVHSIIAGAALGLGDAWVHVAIIFTAIICHKGAAAFALMVTMIQAGVSRRLMFNVLILFALMTPL